ncbi:hypothetical protein JX265_008958 [Neoarthrinium moseri]|uniref:Uncharacterized protein n=1 Tax=Neoarthrinium moseri TaxID=1658444 RepID=A0A9Q0AN01_9PEZI|nr:hypothetical protein JX265_008958 [Neoarthrinium moseri]
MYYRMPPALKASQFGPPDPTPRYYDYTEEFENKTAQPTKSLETLAPIPTRASSTQRPLVLREGSEEQLAAAFDDKSAPDFSDDDDHQGESDAETEPHLLSDIETPHEGTTRDRKPNSPARVSGTDPRAQIIPSLTLGMRKLTRGSDIDLLPSQVRRTSVDTFRPSLDIESPEVPLFSYPNFRHRTSEHTNTPSPARQVQVHVKTPTIRSEQGVILRDDEHDSTNGTDDASSVNDSACEPPLREPRTPRVPTHGFSNPYPMLKTAQDMLKTSSKGSDNYSTLARTTAVADPFKPGSHKLLKGSDAHQHLPCATAVNGCGSVGIADNNSSIETSGATDRLETNPSDNRTARGVARTNDDGTGRILRPPLRNDDHNKNDQRNHADLKVITNGLPQDEEEIPQLTPSCSLTPLISPKPISPARELRVKNSIPQLMKALPPLPGQPGYVSPPSSTGFSDDDGDDFVAVLRPYRFSQSGISRCRDASELARNAEKPPARLQKPKPDIQKKLPRIRAKSKVSIAEAPSNHRESRPWNSEKNYPWCNDVPPIELVDVECEVNKHESLREKPRVSSSRTASNVDSRSNTVRRRPQAGGSGLVQDIASQQRKDLFSFSSGLGSVFRQVSRKFSQSSHKASKPESASTFYDAETPSPDQSPETKPRVRLRRSTSKYKANDHSFDKDSAIEKRHGLKKHFSDLRWLLARSTRTQTRETPNEGSNFLHAKRGAVLESTFGLGNTDFDSKDISVGEGNAPTKQPRPRLRRRMRARISKWVRGTKTGGKHRQKGTSVTAEDN